MSVRPLRPRLLDLFCGAGGAAMGYHRAGFDVVGVDIAPQPRYPFEFVQGDALEVVANRGFTAAFSAIHASPPCQGYVQWRGINREKWGSVPEHPMLVEPLRSFLWETNRPFVIENVVGAPLENATTLCGSMFSLGVRRHRLFEPGRFFIFGQKGCHHTRKEIAVYGKLDGRRIWTRSDGSEVRCADTLEQGREAMGIDWMTWDELREAIPPAYTQFIGDQLLAQLNRVPA